MRMEKPLSDREKILRRNKCFLEQREELKEKKYGQRQSSFSMLYLHIFLCFDMNEMCLCVCVFVTEIYFYCALHNTTKTQPRTRRRTEKSASKF
jgi:hypothetical protein